MRVRIEKFFLEVEENEMWELLFIIRAGILSDINVTHWRNYGGVDGFKRENQVKLGILETIASVLCRMDLVDSLLEEVKHRIEVL